MKVQFLGAAQTVTGSCYMIEANGKRFCVDCGMHQGNKAIEARNRDTKPYRPQDIDFILVTHAHIDHSGLLPKMVREGYAKPIYCTRATGELLELMLEDSAHIQEMEAQSEARKYLRRGLTNPPAALYATCEALSLHADQDTMEALATYAARLPAEFGVLLMRDAVERDAALVESPAFARWAEQNAAVLM